MLLPRPDSRTPISLLDALRSGENDRAWAIFYDKYGIMISNWCTRWGATREESEDIVQETILVVFRKIATFQYDQNRSFRSWLKKVSYHIWLMVFHNKKKASSGDNSGTDKPIHDLNLLIAMKELGDILDHVAEQEIHSLAISNVIKKVSVRNWNIYELCEIQNQDKSQVASELGISVGFIHVIVSRVKKLIELEINSLGQAKE